MITRLLFAFLAALCIERSDAADARSVSPKTISIETHSDGAFGALSVRAEILPLEEFARISSLSLHWLGREIVVPADAYSDLQRPDTASFTFGVWLPAPDRPELEVSFRLYDARYLRRVDRPARVTLMFSDGHLVSRTITWFTESGDQQSETMRFKT